MTASRFTFIVVLVTLVSACGGGSGTSLAPAATTTLDVLGVTYNSLHQDFSVEYPTGRH